MANYKIRETVIKNWAALVDALHADSIIPKQAGQGGHYRAPFVFRGMSDSKWALATSLERLKSLLDVVEPGLLRSFRKYAPRGTFARNSDWEALSVAQHNGLPTRLLDWSVSPLIAAHFATVEREYFSKHGVIWCVDVIALRDRVLPPEIAEPIQRAPAAVYDVALLEAAYPRLADFDATESTLGEACIFFEPPSLDARIANQTGILSTMNGAAVSHQKYLEKVATTYPDVVRRIVINKAAKSEIRDKLDQNNIHERMLFPGLPGLCDWLKRYYGPA
jgi:FRG domain